MSQIRSYVPRHGDFELLALSGVCVGLDSRRRPIAIGHEPLRARTSARHCMPKRDVGYRSRRNEGRRRVAGDKRYDSCRPARARLVWRSPEAGARTAATGMLTCSEPGARTETLDPHSPGPHKDLHGSEGQRGCSIRSREQTQWPHFSSAATARCSAHELKMAWSKCAARRPNKTAAPGGGMRGWAFDDVPAVFSRPRNKAAWREDEITGVGGPLDCLQTGCARRWR